ncbi:MAG: recombination protein RecR [Candidatus Cloacimonetes bacterium HGW-Cloacimonetes-1]|jgi:recombination protein RecR|nr:MAG: recombination protein RecR [Candidatus Cloacimonetes bacterium HGW-Cloacimonetes-1]
MILSVQFERLVQVLSRFPGIGKKTAQRLAWHLISSDKRYATELAETIQQAVDAFCTCGKCYMLAETDPCPICDSAERDTTQLCVVESSADVFLVENMNEFKGKYFVLGHLLSPIDGFGPEQIRASELVKLIIDLQPQEVVLALKPSAEGEATIHFISEILAGKAVKITRLSTGIPFGGDLEYTSSLTLTNAWKRRYSVQ